jgi:hypothetical protein
MRNLAVASEAVCFCLRDLRPSGCGMLLSGSGYQRSTLNMRTVRVYSSEMLLLLSSRPSGIISRRTRRLFSDYLDLKGLRSILIMFSLPSPLCHFASCQNEMLFCCVIPPRSPIVISFGFLCMRFPTGEESDCFRLNGRVRMLL